MAGCGGCLSGDVNRDDAGVGQLDDERRMSMGGNITASLPRVAVVLGYYMGSKFIRRQVESILAQENVEVCVFIYDDASPTPLTKNDLNPEADAFGRVRISRRNQNLGFQMNILLNWNIVNLISC